MPDNSHTLPSPGAPEIRQRRARVSLVWLVPIAAALVGLSMVVQNWLSAGPQITVSFQTAEGLEANKTQVKYKNVVIGLVTGIRLSEDQTRVIATIELEQKAEPFARKDTQFWVVRPRIGASGVSGVDTLLSGAFIGATRGARTKPGASSSAWKRRRRSPSASRASTSPCTPRTSARWASARPSTTGASRSARWCPTRWPRTARAWT